MTAKKKRKNEEKKKTQAKKTDRKKKNANQHDARHRPTNQSFRVCKVGLATLNCE